MHKSIIVQNVRFDDLTMEELILWATKVCIDKDVVEPKTISLANPEIVLEAQRNKKLLTYLQNTDYCVADGVGILIYAKAIGERLRERVTGTDFLPRLVEQTSLNNFSIYFLGGKPGVANNAKSKLLKIYPEAKIIGTRDGYFDANQIDSLINEINKLKPDCIMVCLGFPKQEAFIAEYKSKFKTKLIFGNGGALDFWSGNVKRAPKVFINLNIEWLYRLMQDFGIKRIKRQLKLIRFVYLILKIKLFKVKY